MLRPRTPPFLRRFVIELYGGRCLRCGVDRPIEVAHLAPWPVVRDHAMQQPGPDPLKSWRILRKLRCCPWRAGQLAKAIHVLQVREA
jgi:hypothetical protein